MTQINLSWIKRNWQIIVITLLLLVVLFQRCEPQSQLAESHKQKSEQSLKNARSESLKLIDIKKNYKDKLKKKDLEIDKLKRNSEINNKLLNAKLKRVMNYNNSDIANYYIERYNQSNAVKSIGANEVAIKDTLSRFIISDLIKYDGIKYDYKTLNKEYLIVNEKFNLANKTVDTLNLSINNISTAYEIANNERLQQIKQVEKQVKKERREKNIYKIITIATIVAGGYLLAK